MREFQKNFYNNGLTDRRNSRSLPSFPYQGFVVEWHPILCQFSYTFLAMPVKQHFVPLPTFGLCIMMAGYSAHPHLHLHVPALGKVPF